MTALLPWLAEASASESLLAVLLHVVVGLGLSAGVGAAVATLRVIVPGLAAASDRALARTGGRRLLLMGVLPLLGVALLAQVVAQANHATLGTLFGVLVLVPTGLLLLWGLLAALPHLGERLLERGDADASRGAPLWRAVGGGIALGLSATTAWVPPLFAVLLLLLGGWLLGIGLSCVLGGRTPTPEPP